MLRIGFAAMLLSGLSGNLTFCSGNVGDDPDLQVYLINVFGSDRWAAPELQQECRRDMSDARWAPCGDFHCNRGSDYGNIPYRDVTM